MQLWTIIPAAGQGQRFGHKKQFVALAGKPAFLHAVERFRGLPELRGIVLVVPEEDLEQTRSLVTTLREPRLTVVPGGPDRQSSVRRGFERVPPSEETLVLVHDAVRPLVSRRTIDAVVAGASRDGACIAATPIGDTIKRGVHQNGRDSVLETIDRDGLWAAQTPQGFRYPILKRALEAAEQAGFLGTDESSLVERTGIPVQIVPGDPWNLKITTPEDLEWAERILQG